MRAGRVLAAMRGNSMFLRFWTNAKGATAIEYALIASLISVAIIGGATAIGNSTTVQLNNIASNL
jgi:pilus assembly protein Flp/PilA